MADWKRNLKYDHIFVVIRLDTYRRPGLEGQQSITVTKAFWSKEAAKAEVTRLNAVNKGKESRYIWKLARLERKAESTIPD